MFNKTSSVMFTKYGHVIDTKFQDNDKLEKLVFNVKKNHLEDTLTFNKECYIEVKKGIVNIVLKDEQSNLYLPFVIHGNIKLNPNIKFFLVGITDNSMVDVYYEKDDKYKRENSNNKNFQHQTIRSNNNVNEIYAYFFKISQPGYISRKESHDYFELTYIEDKQLISVVDGKEYTLNTHDIMIYTPNQVHQQFNYSNEACSYLTIVFQMDLDIYKLLEDKVFNANQKTQDIVNKLVNKMYLNNAYDDELALTYLKELILVLLQNEHTVNNKPNIVLKNEFEVQFINNIITYISSNIYQNIDVDDLCQEFLISRTSLQNYFKQYLNTSPKKYINQLKLNECKQLLMQNIYTITEVSDMFGFSSIHYFSRAFKNEFKMSPQSFIKLYKS